MHTPRFSLIKMLLVFWGFLEKYFYITFHPLGPFEIHTPKAIKQHCRFGFKWEKAGS